MSMHDQEMQELRFDVPRAVFDVWEMIRLAKRFNKQQMGIWVLTEWAREQAHIAKVVANVTRGKGIEAPTDWGSLGD